MSYENVKLWFAKDKDNNIMTIGEVNDENKNDIYCCPVCGSELKPKAIKSKRITPHFAHVDASKCNSESQIHFWFKNKFLEVGDKFTVVSDKEKQYTVKELIVEKEYMTDSGIYRPDVTVITECGNTVYFEMAFSNKKKVKDYLDMWLELKNIVVEIDIKELMNKSKLPKFKALFYDGKCFNVKKNDVYYNIIGKYKEEKIKENDDVSIKEQIKKLDWFWNDVIRYKNKEVDIEHIVNLIDSIDGEEKEIVDKILKRNSCSMILKDYFEFKTSNVYKNIANYVVNKYGKSSLKNIRYQVIEYVNKSVKGLITIEVRSFNISEYTEEELCGKVDRYIKNNKELFLI